MLTIEELLGLVRSRRSVRSFQKDRDVPDEYVEKILEAARWAPSGGNSQPWEFVVIRDEETRKRIVDLFTKQSEDKIEMEQVVRGSSRNAVTGFRNAPVFFLVLGDARVNKAFPIRTFLDKGHQHFISGLASATLLIHLAATSLGLGSQWVSDSGSPYMSTMLKSWLGIPNHLHVYDLIPIGFPAGGTPGSRRPRRPLEAMVHRERYDPQKERNDSEIRQFLMEMTNVGNYGRISKDASRTIQS